MRLTSFNLRMALMTLAYCAYSTAAGQDCSQINSAIAEIGKSSSTLLLPRARECYVREGSYWCVWVMPSSEKAASDFNSTIAELQTCIKGGELRRRERDAESASASVTGDSVRAHLSRRGAEVALSLERVEE